MMIDNKENPGSLLNIPVIVIGNEKQENENFTFRHSNHSLERASQRGISSEKLNVALAYGKPYHRQGYIFYVLGENDIPDFLLKERNRLKNTIVMVDGDSGLVITCYRCSEPHKLIKNKSKNYYIDRQAA
jgi:hypothetical protein